jgi:hypothetical protein
MAVSVADMFPGSWISDSVMDLDGKTRTCFDAVVEMVGSNRQDPSSGSSP